MEKPMKAGTIMDHIEKIAHYRYFNKLTYKEIAKIYDVTEQTIRKVVDEAVKRDMLPEYAKGRAMTFNNQKEYRMEKMGAVHDALLNRMSENSVIEEASLNELASSAKKVYDMIRLEDNKSTTNTAVSGLIHLIEAANKDGEL